MIELFNKKFSKNNFYDDEWVNLKKNIKKFNWKMGEPKIHIYIWMHFFIFKILGF